MKHLKEENNKIKADFKNELLSYKKIIDELKAEILKKNEIRPKIINPFSYIQLIDTNQFKQLNNWINPLVSLSFELIFKASENGDSSEEFHKFCDGKGPTVVIVKGKNCHIFGGYLTVPFSSDNKYHYDDKAFLFSLTNKKRFPIKIKDKAVFHMDSWGPYIGFVDNCDLAIFSECVKEKNKKSYSMPKSYEFKRIDLIGNEERNFEVSDYEVYLVN